VGAPEDALEEGLPAGRPRVSVEGRPVDRPRVSVVMPFAGEPADAHAALSALRALATRPGDELILADNSGTGAAQRIIAGPDAVGTAGGDAVGSAAGNAVGSDAAGTVGGARVLVVRATAERSPAHARNVGAEHAHSDWILFLDADCRAPEGLLDAYFAAPVSPDVGALAGEVVPALGAPTLAARYGAARGFLSQETHLAHPYRPRAVAANLLVRRLAFESLGGFYEGMRAAEDTDLSWRLQQARWRLELRRAAWVEHHYRATLGELRRQWRAYAAGRAWLARRYEGFTPEPALRRALLRAAHRSCGAGTRGSPSMRTQSPRRPPGRMGRAGYLAIDALLAGEELVGLMLSNRPADRNGVPRARPAPIRAQPARTVLVAERFPAPGDPLVQFALRLKAARVEAAARPEVVDVQAARELHVAYREDDGTLARALALVRLAGAHPLRCGLDVVRARSMGPSLPALAPAALRLQGDPATLVQPLSVDDVSPATDRLAALAGRRLEPRRR